MQQTTMHFLRKHSSLLTSVTAVTLAVTIGWWLRRPMKVAALEIILVCSAWACWSREGERAARRIILASVLWLAAVVSQLKPVDDFIQATVGMSGRWFLALLLVPFASWYVWTLSKEYARELAGNGEQPRGHAE